MFNPSRLELARKRRGLTKVGLAELAGISVRTLTEYEAGRTTPSRSASGILASKLKFPEEFFAGDDVHMPAPEAVTFRARASLAARDRDRSLGGMSLAFMLSDYVIEKFNLPACDLPDGLNDMKPQGAAMALRAQWSLGDRAIENVVHLLEAHGVKVFSLRFAGELDAIATWRGNAPYVFLNVSKSAERVRFDAAHELGHLVLHRQALPDPRQAELEANQFAAAFLMPEPRVKSIVTGLVTMRSLIEAKKHFGVSVMALARRVWDLHLASDWHYHTLCVQCGQRGYQRNEPEPMRAERSQIWDKVFELLRQDGITKSTLAMILGLHREDVEELVFGLTMGQVGDGRGRDTTTSVNTANLELAPRGGPSRGDFPAKGGA
jgi:Zn-dependent peptidase ImmA (M78 family)/DNA-binding XRE family transcriptional regulator